MTSADPTAPQGASTTAAPPARGRAAASRPAPDCPPPPGQAEHVFGEQLPAGGGLRRICWPPPASRTAISGRGRFRASGSGTCSTAPWSPTCCPTGARVVDVGSRRRAARAADGSPSTGSAGRSGRADGTPLAVPAAVCRRVGVGRPGVRASAAGPRTPRCEPAVGPSTWVTARAVAPLERLVNGACRSWSRVVGCSRSKVPRSATRSRVAARYCPPSECQRSTW